MNSNLLEFFEYIKVNIYMIYEEVKQKKKYAYENKFLKLYWEYNYDIEKVNKQLENKEISYIYCLTVITNYKNQLDCLKEESNYKKLYDFFKSIPNSILQILI